MKSNAKILIIDDNPDLLTAMRLFLGQHFTEVEIELDPKQIDARMESKKYDAIILDMNFSKNSTSGKEGLFWLGKIQKLDVSVAVILMTAYADIELAVEGIRKGATDFLEKPSSNSHLLAKVLSAIRNTQSARHSIKLRNDNSSLIKLIDETHKRLIGESEPMRNVQNLIKKAAPSDANILLMGETGTGKGLAAREIHSISNRSNGPFISLDIASLSPTIFESELFGHRKGAFTDATQDKTGRFELANGGTLFLDELGNLPWDQQNKLLGAIQSKEITPVGSTEAHKVDVRIICASNENLALKSENGEFRTDLLYRVNTVEITLPPLRKRRSDIPLLVEYYLNIYNERYKSQAKVRDSEIDLLINYDWPGNVRELEHSIERAIILSETEFIDAGLIVGSFSSHDSKETVERKYEFNLEIVEKQTIKDALTHFKGNLSHAAQALGLSRGALYRRLEKYGI